jgi:putative hydrolase of HD superfamily
MNILKFAHEISTLKSTKRSGWIRSQIKDPESIADHMYRMALLAFMIPANDQIDRSKIIKMALIHDVAEAKAGDITPHDGISEEEKRKLEADGMGYLVNLLNGNEEALEMRELWLEYEDGLTLEAQIVKDLDKFEMICQAYEYEVEQNKSLESFFTSTMGKFKTDIVKSWVSLLLEERHRTNSL